MSTLPATRTTAVATRETAVEVQSDRLPTVLWWENARAKTHPALIAAGSVLGAFGLAVGVTGVWP